MHASSKQQQEETSWARRAYATVRSSASERAADSGECSARARVSGRRLSGAVSPRADFRRAVLACRAAHVA
eukprot:5227503-Pleurochrysis_carterae.AAC.1